MFYYTLGNLSPKYRSFLRAIQLACVAPVSVVNKYGVDAVLAPVVQQLKKLEQVINYIISPGHLKFRLYMNKYVYLLCMVVVL